MRVFRFSSLLGASAAALAFLFAGPLAAQTVITGRVTSVQGSPIGGASVTVENSSIGTATAEDGTYRLTVASDAARGQRVTLVARRIGLRPIRRSVTLQTGTQQQIFVLEPDPLRLEEVVVTGVGEATARNKLTFAVGTVDEQQLQAVPGRSAVEAIQGKVPGARLIPSSSQPGGEVAIRLRGATSISGRQDPIVIVDGVISRFGLADIASEDIERVEVIKGAAASSLYGSNAANGVVQVFTKRGRSLPEGTLKVTSRTEAGINQMPNEMQFSPSHAFRIGADGNYVRTAQGARIIETDQIADNPFKTYLNHWDALVDNGMYTTSYLSVGQRRGSTNFNASGQHTRNQGVIFGLGGYSRQNFRLNLDQQIRSNVDASFSTFFGTSKNGRTEEGQGGPFFGLMFVQPDVDIVAACPDSGSAAAFAGTPYCPVVPLSGDVANDFNPLYELANRKITQDRNRFSGSGRARWRLVDWLTAEGSLGYDSESESFSDIIPFGYVTSTGTKDDGRLIKSSINSWQYNTGATLTSVRTLFGEVRNTTKVGATYEKQLNRFIAPTADKLVVERVPEFGGADPGSIRSSSGEEAFQTQNYLAITTFDIKDRYILDGLIRRDGSSLFGPEERWATYYRVSGAWRVTEDITIPGVDEFRLRASQGTAGLRPGYNFQYEILQVTPGGFSKETLGNPFLKPAHSTELELGTNLAFGKRFTFEYTWARKDNRDQILLVDLPAVAGFKQQWQNTGALESKTHEVAFGARLIDRPGTSLMLNIVGDRTRQVITEWNLPERLYSFQQMPSAFFLGNGSDLGVMYGNRWIRTIEELYDDPAKAAAQGPGQAWDRNNFMINEDGYIVLKTAYGTINERAIKYVRCKRTDATGTCVETTNIVEIGNANPDFNLSFNPVLNLGRFSMSGLLDWSKGGNLYNGTRQWAFQATRDRAQNQAVKPANAAACGTTQANPTSGSCSRKALGYYAVGFYNGLDPNDYFVEDGSYMKLKELAVSYTFAPTQLKRLRMQELKIGFIGRNLFTMTDYSGLDPEVSGLFGDPFQVKMDWFQYPQFRTFSAVVEFSF